MMKQYLMVMLRHCGVVALALALWPVPDATAQSGNAGARIAAKLQRAGVIDNYYPEVALEVANTLIKAAPGPWQGVQVNQAHRAGWVNIYLLDARKLPDNGLLDDEGVPNFTAENLRGGALAHEDTHTIFLNTAMWKRLTAATLMKQTRVHHDLMAALAAIDVAGLDAARRFWDPATLSVDNDVNQRTGMLMRGALAFVLAHEMGHLKLGRMRFDEPDRLRLDKLTPRQKDERLACPELIDKEARERQKLESAADLAGVAMLGAQCRIGNDGPLRHGIYMLGTSWYFLAAMSDKMLDMGRSTDSPLIARLLRTKLGPQLYEQAVVARARDIKRGAVAPAFPLTHPPDFARVQAIESALRATPCGGSNIDSSELQLMEMFRTQMCRGLMQQGSAR